MPAAPVRGAPGPRGLPGRRAALVRGLRRQRHPRGGAAAVPRRGAAPREDRLHLRNRLLEPLSALHEDLRLPWHPRARAAGRRRRQDGEAGSARIRQHRRRRLLQHRRRPLDPRRALQHEHDGVPARQPRLRPDQEAGFADLAARATDQHDPARRIPGGVESLDRHAGGAERVIRRPGGRLDPGDSLQHRFGGVPPQGILLRAHPAALPEVPAGPVRSLAARSAEGPGPPPRQRASAEPGARQGAQEPARARSRRSRPGARDRLRRRPDSGGHPLSQSRGPLLRGPAAKRQAAHRRIRESGPRSGARQVHHLAAGARITGMHSELQAQLAFHLTGVWSAGRPEASDALELRPALLSAYLNLTSLRYDFPLVLARNAPHGGAVQSLSGLMDRAIEDAAPRDGEGERIRGHVLRMEQAIRALVAAGGGGSLATLWDTAAGRLESSGEDLLADSLSRARAALKADGGGLGCGKAMPARLFEHAWRTVQESKARRFREDIDRLILRLSDILAAGLALSEEGRSPERLRAEVGAAPREAFDFEAMSRLLAGSLPQGTLPHIP